MSEFWKTVNEFKGIKKKKGGKIEKQEWLQHLLRNY